MEKTPQDKAKTKKSHTKRWLRYWYFMGTAGRAARFPNKGKDDEPWHLGFSQAWSTLWEGPVALTSVSA